MWGATLFSQRMLRVLAPPSLKPFDAPSHPLVLAPCHVHSDHHEHGPGIESMAVFDRRKGGYTPEGFFFLKRSDVGKNPTVACTPAHPSSKIDGRGMSLLGECAPVYFFSTKGKLW